MSTRAVTAFVVAAASILTVALHQGARADEASTPADETKLSAPKCQPVEWTLRLDFNNIDIYDCKDPGLFPLQKGAQVTVTFDKLAHTRSIAGDGVVAGLVHIPDDGVFLGVVVGPYLQGDGAYQFSSPTAPSKQTSTVTLGGFLQSGFDDQVILGGEHYVRVREGVIEGSSGITTTSFVGEWVPAKTFFLDADHSCALSVGLHRMFDCGTSDPIIMYALIPELIVETDHLDDGPRKYQLFASRDSAFRVGPQVSLALGLRKGAVSNAFVDAILSGLTLSNVYHASTNTIAGRGYSWDLTTLTYKISENFGLSASYGAGNSDITANTASQIKVGLSVKY